MHYCSLGKLDKRCLDGFYLRLVKRILFLSHHYHLSYDEAENRTGVERPSIRLAKERMRWSGHSLREVLLFVPEGGRCGRGRRQ